MEYWNDIVVNGIKYIYLYKISWGKKLYSFDRGITWHGKKYAAFYQAVRDGNEHVVILCS